MARILSKIHSIYDLIYWQPLEFIYQKVAPNIPGSGRSLIFIFDLLPKFWVAFIFLIEIVALNQLKFFFIV